MFSTDVADTPPFDRVQRHVADLIKGKVIVGHSLWHDLSGRVHAFFLILATKLITCSSGIVLGIPHPAVSTRDVALYQPFRNALRSPNQVVGLQTLMWHLMCRRCQDGHIHPVRLIVTRPPRTVILRSLRSQNYSTVPPFIRLRMHEPHLTCTARSRWSGSQRSHWATGRPVFLRAPSRGAICDFTPRTFFWSSCSRISSVCHPCFCCTISLAH